MPLYAVLVHQVQVLLSGFLSTPVRTRRSCLRLAVHQVNARRRLSLPRFRPCRAYQKRRPVQVAPGVPVSIHPLSEDSVIYTITRALQAEFSSLGGVTVAADLLEGVAGQQSTPD